MKEILPGTPPPPRLKLFLKSSRSLCTDAKHQVNIWDTGIFRRLGACSLQPSAWLHLHNSLLFPSNCGSSQPSTSLVLISVSRVHASTSERLHHWDIFTHTHLFSFFFFFCTAWMSVTTHFVVPATKTDEVVLQAVRLSHRRSVCGNIRGPADVPQRGGRHSCKK